MPEPLSELESQKVRLLDAYPTLVATLSALDDAVVFHVGARVVLANAAAVSLARRPLFGLSVAELVCDDDGARFLDVATSGQPSAHSNPRPRFRPRNDAQAHWVELERLTLQSAEGEPPVGVCVLTDVSAQAPRDERDVRLLFATSVDAVLLIDREGVILRANMPATALLGYTVAELEGMSVDQLIPVAQRAQHAQLRATFNRAPQPRAMRTGATMFALTKSGVSMPIEAALTPLELEGKAVTVVTVRDLASRLEAARALRESETRLRSVFDASSEGIFLADSSGRYVDVNPAGCALLRCSRSDIVGKSMRDFLMPEEGERHPQRLQALRADGRQVMERLMRRHDGTPMLAEISGAVLPGGLLQGFVRDLSELRRVEEAQRQTAKLEAVGRLAGGVAHDFNNILTVVLTLTDELRQRLQSDAGAVELLNELEGAGQRAAELTRQLLAFARRQPNNPRALDVNDELTRLARFMRRVLGEPVELTLHLAPDVPGTHIDPVQFEQCILNLALNARDAMPEGGLLDITTSRHEGGVLLEVKDSGVGMDEVLMRHVFEPFFTTKPTGQGTGLGLATVYGIVTQAGGTLSVRSKPGQGATFSMWLKPAAGRPSAPDVGTASHARVKGSEHILVVEDDALVRTSVERTLRSAGYTVHAVDGLEPAVAAAHELERLDLLLSDVVMPRADGFAVAEAVRLVRPDVPVLFMSGYAPDLQRLSQVAHLVQKPFTAEALLASVRGVLRPSGAGAHG